MLCYGVAFRNRFRHWCPALPITPGTNRLWIVTESTARPTSGHPKHEPTYRPRRLNRLFSCLVLSVETTVLPAESFKRKQGTPQYPPRVNLIVEFAQPLASDASSEREDYR
jgi:hypothetical protein